MMRIREMEESAKILRQALDADARRSGARPRWCAISSRRPANARCAWKARAATGMVRGERRQRVPVAVHVRTGSFAAMGIMQKLSRGLMIADLVVLIASLDVIAPEIDR